jgi:hypothetical protein
MATSTEISTLEIQCSLLDTFSIQERANQLPLPLSLTRSDRCSSLLRTKPPNCSRAATKFSLEDVSRALAKSAAVLTKLLEKALPDPAGSAR